MMGKDDDSNSLDRRIFLGATTATLLGLPGISLAQQQKPSEPDKASDLSVRTPSRGLPELPFAPVDPVAVSPRYRAQNRVRTGGRYGGGAGLTIRLLFPREPKRWRDGFVPTPVGGPGKLTD
jgi:hypothetical protein